MTLHRHTLPGPGESAPFHLESAWRLATSPDRVWQEFHRVANWPSWWPGLAKAELWDAGTRADLGVRSPLGRSLDVTIALSAAHAPLTAHVDVTGDLRGIGTWRARPSDTGTHVDLTWCVVTRLRWLRTLRPLAEIAHRRVMAAGAAGLQRRLLHR